jgi:hypothetical protein
MIVDIPQTASASLSEGIELLIDLAKQGKLIRGMFKLLT